MPKKTLKEAMADCAIGMTLICDEELVRRFSKPYKSTNPDEQSKSSQESSNQTTDEPEKGD